MYTSTGICLHLLTYMYYKHIPTYVYIYVYVYAFFYTYIMYLCMYMHLDISKSRIGAAPLYIYMQAYMFIYIARMNDLDYLLYMRYVGF